jgi:hypothetical protein
MPTGSKREILYDRLRSFGVNIVMIKECDFSDEELVEITRQIERLMSSRTRANYIMCISNAHLSSILTG